MSGSYTTAYSILFYTVIYSKTMKLRHIYSFCFFKENKGTDGGSIKVKTRTFL